MDVVVRHAAVGRQVRAPVGLVPHEVADPSRERALGPGRFRARARERKVQAPAPPRTVLVLSTLAVGYRVDVPFASLGVLRDAQCKAARNKKGRDIAVTQHEARFAIDTR
jgi:hypothetical protein